GPVTAPGYPETPVAVHRRRGVALVALGRRVDRRLAAERVAGRVVAPGEDACAVAVLALPGDHGIPGRAHGHGRARLVALGGAVGLELAAGRVARGIVALGEHAPAATVLVLTLPGDHELP